MLLNFNTDPRDHSTCALSYNETERWLQAIWRGFVNQHEEMRGAQAFLFNDGSRLVGPWFESLK